MTDEQLANVLAAYDLHLPRDTIEYALGRMTRMSAVSASAWSAGGMLLRAEGSPLMRRAFCVCDAACAA